MPLGHSDVAVESREIAPCMTVSYDKEQNVTTLTSIVQVFEVETRKTTQKFKDECIAPQLKDRIAYCKIPKNAELRKC